MHRLRNLPLKRKLTLIIVAICTGTLVLAFAALAAFEYRDLRLSMLGDMTVLSDILAQNSRAALVFGDEKEATEKLQTFRSEPHIVAACLYAKTGGCFASYRRAGADILPPARPGPDGYLFTADALELVRPVTLNDRRIGTLWLQVDREGLRERFLQSGVVALVVLICSFLLALFVTPRLQRPITGPILALSDTARSIAEKSDYSLRAERASSDEVGQLADAFNGMLRQIQQRDSELRKGQAQLQTVFENLGEGVAVSDLDGRLIQFNPAAIRMHGFSSPEEYLRRLPEFADTFELSTLGGTVIPINNWPLARVLRGETLHDFEVRIRRSGTGWKRIFSYGGSLARDADGRAVLAILTIRDVTDRKRIDDEIRRSAEELRSANEELLRFNRSMVDRELRMIELKEEVNMLCLQLGQPPRHALDFDKEHQ